MENDPNEFEMQGNVAKTHHLETPLNHIQDTNVNNTNVDVQNNTNSNSNNNKQNNQSHRNDRIYSHGTKINKKNKRNRKNEKNGSNSPHWSQSNVSPHPGAAVSRIYGESRLLSQLEQSTKNNSRSESAPQTNPSNELHAIPANSKASSANTETPTYIDGSIMFETPYANSDRKNQESVDDSPRNNHTNNHVNNYTNGNANRTNDFDERDQSNLSPHHASRRTNPVLSPIQTQTSDIQVENDESLRGQVIQVYNTVIGILALVDTVLGKLLYNNATSPSDMSKKRRTMRIFVQITCVIFVVYLFIAACSFFINLFIIISGENPFLKPSKKSLLSRFATVIGITSLLRNILDVLLFSFLPILALLSTVEYLNRSNYKKMYHHSLLYLAFILMSAIIRGYNFIFDCIALFITTPLDLQFSIQVLLSFTFELGWIIPCVYTAMLNVKGARDTYFIDLNEKANTRIPSISEDIMDTFHESNVLAPDESYQPQEPRKCSVVNCENYGNEEKFGVCNFHFEAISREAGIIV